MNEIAPANRLLSGRKQRVDGRLPYVCSHRYSNNRHGI